MKVGKSEQFKRVDGYLPPHLLYLPLQPQLGNSPTEDQPGGKKREHGLMKEKQGQLKGMQAGVSFG